MAKIICIKTRKDITNKINDLEHIMDSLYYSLSPPTIKAPDFWGGLNWGKRNKKNYEDEQDEGA